MKTPLLINIFTFIIITTFVGGSSTRADTFDLLEMSEKLDQADKQDFISSIDKANACIRQHNFKCTETELTKASKMANGSRDKQMLLSVRENMTNEKNMILKEQQRIAEEERRAKVAEAERLRQQQAAADKSNDFQWGKLAAMGVGAAIGGVGHLSSEVQTKIVTAAIKDSMAGQQGISNFQNTADGLREEQKIRQAIIKKQDKESHIKAMADEAANNERLLNAGRESRQPNGGKPFNKQAQVDNATITATKKESKNERPEEIQKILKSDETWWHDDYSNTAIDTGETKSYPDHERNISGRYIASIKDRVSAETVWSIQGGKVTDYYGSVDSGHITVVVDYGHVIDIHRYVRDK